MPSLLSGHHASTVTVQTILAELSALFFLAFQNYDSLPLWHSWPRLVQALVDVDVVGRRHRDQEVRVLNEAHQLRRLRIQPRNITVVPGSQPAQKPRHLGSPETFFAVFLKLSLIFQR